MAPVPLHPLTLLSRRRSGRRWGRTQTRRMQGASGRGRYSMLSVCHGLAPFDAALRLVVSDTRLIRHRKSLYLLSRMLYQLRPHRCSAGGWWHSCASSGVLPVRTARHPGQVPGRQGAARCSTLAPAQLQPLLGHKRRTLWQCGKARAAPCRRLHPVTQKADASQVAWCMLGQINITSCSNRCC